MSRFATLREKLIAYLGNVMPKPQKRLTGKWKKVAIGFQYGLGVRSLKSR